MSTAGGPYPCDGPVRNCIDKQSAAFEESGMDVVIEYCVQ
jgi:hypothetical protein